jgi:anti-sigma factor RsiW
LNCQRALELIHPYVDRELDPMQSAEVEQHLEQCEQCQLSYRDQIALHSALQDVWFRYRAPAELRKHIRSLLHEEANQQTHTATS